MRATGTALSDSILWTRAALSAVSGGAVSKPRMRDGQNPALEEREHLKPSPQPLPHVHAALAEQRTVSQEDDPGDRERFVEPARDLDHAVAENLEGATAQAGGLFSRNRR
jgi:hypothetical protein